MILVFQIGLLFCVLVYGLLLLYLRYNWLKTPIFIFDKNKNFSKGISVIIAVRNEEDNICNLLNSLLLQGYETESFEIILVNDNSTDNTFRLAKEFSDEHNHIHLLSLSNGLEASLRTTLMRGI